MTELVKYGKQKQENFFIRLKGIKMLYTPWPLTSHTGNFEINVEIKLRRVRLIKLLNYGIPRPEIFYILSLDIKVRLWLWLLTLIKTF